MVIGKCKGIINNLKIRDKLILFYIVCVLLPLIVTDVLIVRRMVEEERRTEYLGRESIANAVENDLDATIDDVSWLANRLYLNRKIYNFVEKEYPSAEKYYRAWYEMMQTTLFIGKYGMGSTTADIYADNPTIINGAWFSRIDKIRDTEWYKEFCEAGTDRSFKIFYDRNERLKTGSRRAIFIRRMDYSGNAMEKLVVLELDVSAMARSLEGLDYRSSIYVCEGDRILYSNSHNLASHADFPVLSDAETGSYYEREINLYGQQLTIRIKEMPIDAVNFLKRNLLLLIILVLINILFPLVLVMIINRSLVQRLGELSQVFRKVNEDRMPALNNVRGSDEIGSLMYNYNRMAGRMNELIETVYKSRLRAQENDIARQNAELLALHSQINPHFLFNALESIRMHSILRGEDETAEMVEKLAAMERSNVYWGSDLVTIGDEVRFVDNYLGLQKYRFGDRISYAFEVEDSCRDYCIPKTSIATFVENACVHGVGKKSSKVWIFVRAYEKNGMLHIEIEDTGNGMSDEDRDKMLEEMRSASIEKLKGREHIGVINACLRIRMVSGQTATFDVSGEEGLGMLVDICIPAASLPEKEQAETDVM